MTTTKERKATCTRKKRKKSRKLQAISCITATNLILTSFVPSHSETKFSFVSALLRLSFSVYMSNYLLVRSEFFGRKELFVFDWYLTTKRVFSTGILVLIVSYVYHVLCVAPFNSLRRMIFERKRSKGGTKVE